MKYHNNAKLTIFQRKELARRINDGEPVSKVAKDFNALKILDYKTQDEARHFLDIIRCINS